MQIINISDINIKLIAASLNKKQMHMKMCTYLKKLWTIEEIFLCIYRTAQWMIKKHLYPTPIFELHSN
jgi:hypothetical protein